MRKPTPKIHSRQDFLERQAQHQLVLRRARRNSFRLLRALSSVGVGVSWDGRYLRIHGPRLRARTKNRIKRLGVHFISAVEATAQLAMASETNAPTLVQ